MNGFRSYGFALSLVENEVMVRVIVGSDPELKWVDGDRLKDLDFADDTTLLDSTWKGMKDLTHRT